MKHNPAKRGLGRVGCLCVTLLKWGDYGLIRFSGQVDGGMSRRGALPQSLRTWLRSAPSTLLSKLMSEAELKPELGVVTTTQPVLQYGSSVHHASKVVY